MEKVAIPAARVMRIVWFGFVLSGVMLIYVAVTIPVQAPRPMRPAVEVILAIVALVAVVLGFFMPQILRRSAKQARQGQTEPVALNTWFRDNLVGLGWIYACNVFAFILHFFHARAGLVDLLFGVGMIALLMFRPGTPPAPQAGILGLSGGGPQPISPAQRRMR